MHACKRCGIAVIILTPLPMQGLVEELKRLRAAEESAMTALVDEEMTARFSGDVTLTVRDAPIVLSPDQARLFLDFCMWAS